MNREAAKGNVHDFIKRQKLVKAALARDLVKRRHEHRRMNRTALQCGVTRRAPADLKKGHILLRVHAVFSQDHNGFAVWRAAETADTEDLSLQVFDSFDIGSGNEIVVGAVHDSHHDSY